MLNFQLFVFVMMVFKTGFKNLFNSKLQASGLNLNL